jgi:hypothetical protein
MRKNSKTARFFTKISLGHPLERAVHRIFWDLELEYAIGAFRRGSSGQGPEKISDFKRLALSGEHPTFEN